MDFDEYEYLEKSVEDTEIRKGKEHRSSRHHRDHDKDGGGGARRSRAEEHNGDKVDSGERDRPERREKDRHRSSRDAESQRDKDRDHRGRDRDHRERDRENEKGREREREVGERERPKESEREKERERDRSRRSSSKGGRQEREVEREMEKGRSRERALRERELERDVMDRENRRFKEKKEAVEPEADPERDQRTVFAYQMPLKATEKDIYEFFSKAGKVRDVRLIMDRSSRRSKGVGYVEFYDSMSVPMAIALSGHQFLGQPVMVKPSEAEKNLVQSTATGGSGIAGAAVVRKIYVGNLHFNMTEDQLRKASAIILLFNDTASGLYRRGTNLVQKWDRKVFEPFGEVELVQLPLDLETGQCKGYGFIQFAQVEHAKAALTLNGNLDIAGRIIKVSAVTDHIGFQDSVANAANFDDDEGGGLSLNARSRALLMQKLDRTGTASSIAESLGAPVLNGALPTQQTLSLPINRQVMVPATLPGLLASSITEPIGEPSECVLLKNMFDPSTETEPDFDLDIKDEVEEECSKFGPVKHIYVEKNSNGYVYLQFDSVASASNCQHAMHMRWFARRSISATFMRPHEYKARFKSG